MKARVVCGSGIGDNGASWLSSGEKESNEVLRSVAELLVLIVSLMPLL